MVRWSVVHGEILDTVGDGLICSANPSLNLSGGVGGAFLLRYGPAMQTFLQDYLRDNNLRFVSPGSVVLAPACGSRFKAVAHAVAIDAFYDTDLERIVATYRSAIAALTAIGCRSIVSACLGCGYGRVTPTEFAVVVRRLVAMPFVNVDELTLVTTNGELAEAIGLALCNVDS